ncbi:phosphodiester glycosidase family protein [Amycolatopsis tucumanensis]|uniref:phosphodiester glycosidase family protein n=1 Tax=Amycolatopsis tucumanensis TaxID=401106 RepID=UPI003D716F63
MSLLTRATAAVAALLLLLVTAPAAVADTALARGVAYRTLTLSTAHGPVVAHLVTADLTDPRVDVDLLHPASVAERATVSALVTAQHAVAGINGDFFNISETHAGITPTGSSVGPEIADGDDLKYAVPDGQRFGPAMPSGVTTSDVFGFGADHRLRTARLEFAGTLRSRAGEFDLEGLNQYALPVDGIGVYTPEWGSMSRARAACGTDTSRSAPCTSQVEEVVVRHGVVVAESAGAGAGPIEPGSVVLLGRERGATELAGLRVGDRVLVTDRLVARGVPPFEFAVGGFPILDDGAALPGLDASLAPRTAAGASADGRTLYLLAVDGRSAASTGMGVGEVAALLVSLGASEAVNLDGGGSTTLVTAGRGAPVTVRNTPSDGAERAVANGIGVFVR